MSQEIQEAVYKQQEVIKDKQLSVKEDLDQVEPAVIEAQNGMVVHFVACLNGYKYLFEFTLLTHGCKGFLFTMQPLTSSCHYCLPCLVIIYPLVHLMLIAVKSIKKQHLVEVRSMANPPAAVKLALESICLLLGESTTDWKQIRSIIMRENFIPTIVNFSADEIR